MGGKNHHNEPFDASTLVKLDLYRRYVRAWLPVFLNTRSLTLDRIQIFDFFAGPGHDVNGVSGSPIIALEEIRSALDQAHANNTEIHLYLNEMMKGKYDTLRATCEASDLVNTVHFHYLNKDFQEAFNKWKPEFTRNEGTRFKTANLLFLDQNGTKQITREVFSTIVGAARTDFLFFISSSYIYRFKNQPQNVQPSPINESDFDGMTMKNVHRKVCDAYRRWLPNGYRYYLAPFSIAKDYGSNVYGLIFGSGHPLGMDKFLKICWETDPLTGEANYDIDDDNIIQGQLTFWDEKPKKLDLFERHLSEAVLNGSLKTNVDVYEYSLNQGFRASQAKSILGKLVKENKLPRQTFAISYDSCIGADVKPKPINLLEARQK